MEIQHIGKGNLVIYVEGSELGLLPAKPCDMTTCDAEQLLRSAIGNTYEESRDSIYFELFPGRDSLLLFARMYSSEPSFFSFTNIEPLIDAAGECPSNLLSYLTYMDGTYILIIYPWLDEAPPAVLSEFGRELERPGAFALHLLEHASVLAGPSALDLLKNVF